MCENQRATFAKVVIEDNGTKDTYYTASVKRRTTWLTIGGMVIAAIVGLLTIRGAVIEGVREIARAEFRQDLQSFHDVAIPEIDDLIDAKIELHDNKSELRSVARINELKVQLTQLDVKVTELQKTTAENKAMIQELLRRK
jgi:hypothetical protein